MMMIRSNNGTHTTQSSTAGSSIDTSCSDDDDEEEEDDEGSIIDDSEMLDMSEGAGGGGKGGGGGEDEKVRVGNGETRALRCLRMAILVVLVLSAVGVALGAYFATTGSETVKFEVTFQSYSTHVLEGIGKSLEKNLEAIDAIQTSLVIHARSTNQTWPFVTMDHNNFLPYTSKMRLLSDSLLAVQVHPLVTKEQRNEWEEYALQELDQGRLGESLIPETSVDELYAYNHTVSGIIHNMDNVAMPDNTSVMLPMWQTSPAGNYENGSMTSWDLLSRNHPEAVLQSLDTQRAVLSPTYNLVSNNNPNSSNNSKDDDDKFAVEWLRHLVPADRGDSHEPFNEIYYPIVEDSRRSYLVRTSEESSNVTENVVVGILTSIFYWRDLIQDLLPAGANGVVVVFSSTCSSHSFTYQIDSANATYLGHGDLHESQFDAMVVRSSLYELGGPYIVRRQKSDYPGLPFDTEYCPFAIKVYPSTTLYAQFKTTSPMWLIIGTFLVFGFTSAVFLLYDHLVQRRQRKVMKSAVRTNAIVASLFPSVVRDRLFAVEPEEKKPKKHSKKKKSRKVSRPNTSPESRLDAEACEGSQTQVDGYGDAKPTTPPIAELFPDTTVLFADIVGFTAWSSVREPTQVFTLLETLYGAFDAVARRRRVFKVETIGDSYVAVCGLPEPRADHAVVMVRFAMDCRNKMNELTRRLEATLGPDTTDLKMRLGLNSGPVTAGVLRGDRARFQLFGDTVNCASRMESNSKPNMIQVSQSTAEKLREAGKSSWLKKRVDLVQAKGKGSLQTYWIDPQRRGSLACGMSEDGEEEPLHICDSMEQRLERLVGWNFETFVGLVRKIVARRVATGEEKQNGQNGVDLTEALVECTHARLEISEVIPLPAFDVKIKVGRKESDDVQLSPTVLSQLRDYITTIAYAYQTNAFHNFEHATNVVISSLKLLQRVVPPEASGYSLENHGMKHGMVELSPNHHLSNPLTQFAIVFAALIHDVDHPGVSNKQLVEEEDPLALLYDNESMIEQNAVAIAWQLLMKPMYKDLRDCLFTTRCELLHFRQLVVNAVMATDMFDTNLMTMREARWRKSFPSEDSRILSQDSRLLFQSSSSEVGSGVMNRQATTVIECLVQAADVAHTMQHWTIYQKWNRRLFEEAFAAYKSDRTETDPAESWYEDELVFFDNFIIPLAKKLKESGVFGDISEEFLVCALDNRKEWEATGDAVVNDLQAWADIGWGDKY